MNESDVRLVVVQIQELASKAKRELCKKFDAEPIDEEELKYYEITKQIIGKIELMVSCVFKDLSRAESFRNIRTNRKDNDDAERAK